MLKSKIPIQTNHWLYVVLPTLGQVPLSPMCHSEDLQDLLDCIHATYPSFSLLCLQSSVRKEPFLLKVNVLTNEESPRGWSPDLPELRISLAIPYVSTSPFMLRKHATDLLFRKAGKSRRCRSIASAKGQRQMVCQDMSVHRGESSSHCC